MVPASGVVTLAPAPCTVSFGVTVINTNILFKVGDTLHHAKSLYLISDDNKDGWCDVLCRLCQHIPRHEPTLLQHELSNRLPI
jgi:hypothetical protein